MLSEKKTAAIIGDHDYRPWPELRHAAASLRKIAAEYEPGSAHTTTAALVMMAFSVEAFVQTLGPGVLKEEWTQGKRPAERWPVTQKLKEIGRKLSVRVDYGKCPWKDIKDLLEARDDLAHAKPALREASGTIEVLPGGGVAPDAFRPPLIERYEPFHNLDVLNRLARVIDDALLPLWVAAGNDKRTFTMHGASGYVVTIGASG